MTTLVDRPNVALLIVDLQEKVVRGAPRRDEVVVNVGRLVTQARRLEVPVVWVQDEENLVPGSTDWQIVAELTPEDGEPRIAKVYGDSFEDTVLEETLAGLAVGRLYVVGAQSDACIRATVHGAMTRGYDVILVSDAHTTEDATEWGGAASRAGHRPHQSVLDPRAGTGSHDRHRRHRGRRLLRAPRPRLTRHTGVRHRCGGSPV